jgi:hypothetical protein
MHTLNKNGHCRPSGWTQLKLRPCHKRYMLMKYLLTFMLIGFTSNSFAYKPGNCEAALESLASRLHLQDKLGKAIDALPKSKQTRIVQPNTCILKNKSLLITDTWLVHMKDDEITIFIEQRHNESYISKYYGPFYSAYKK